MSDETNSTTINNNNNNEQCSVFSEQDKELAMKAKQEYEGGQFDVCLKTLQEILETCPDDPKVLFNLALTEYALSGFQKTDVFRSQLQKIAEKFHCALDNMTTLEEADQCTVFYNMSVLLYYTRQYQTALTIVEKLFRFIGQIDETLSWKICLLLAELDLCTFQPENALATVIHLEKLLNDRASPPSNGLSHSPNMLNDNIEQLKSKISLYKIRCFLMLKSLRTCKKELKQLQNTNSSSTTLTYCRAYFEYLKENPQRALKILTNNQQATSSVLHSTSSHCFYNNLSCIHFHLHKSAFALFYMRRALTENNRLLIEQINTNDRQLIIHQINRKYEILYNLGIQLLFKNQPYPAFECLIDVIHVYSNNIRLWLRLAECCIMIHRSSNDDIFKLEEKLKCVLQAIGTGIHHKLILGNCNTSTSGKKTSTINGNDNCSMDFALYCLKNALAAIPNITESDLQKEETKLYPAPPGNPLRIGDMISLKCSILTAAAYVSLCLNDFVSAKTYATNLLDEPRASPGHKYLARLYLSESLLAMNKVELALNQLDVEMVKTENDLSFKIPITTIDKNLEEKPDTPESTPPIPKTDLVTWLPRDARVGQAIVYYNIAAIYAITNDVDKAFKHFNLFVNLFGKTQPAHSFHIKFYLDLLEGNRHRLQILLKENFGHLTSNKTFVALPNLTHTLSNNNS